MSVEVKIEVDLKNLDSQKVVQLFAKGLFTTRKSDHSSNSASAVVWKYFDIVTTTDDPPVDVPFIYSEKFKKAYKYDKSKIQMRKFYMVLGCEKVYTQI